MSDAKLHLYTNEFHPKRGGIATYSHEFAAAAANLELRVTVFAPKMASAHTKAAYQLMTGTWPDNHNLPTLCRLRQQMGKNIVRNPAKLLLVEPAPILAYGSLPKSIRDKQKPLITLHGSEIVRWQRNPVARFFAKRTLQSAERIIGVSGPIAALASQAFPEFSSKIISVPNALPAPQRLETDGNPSKRAQNDRQMRLLSVGRIHRRKGFEQIIVAIGRLPETQRQQISLTIIGGAKDHTYQLELINLAAKHQVSLSLKIDASDQTLHEAYTSSDAFVLTSMPYKSSVEGFGLVYLEAGAYGLPCLAYDIGGVRDAVLHGKTGYLMPPGDTITLSERISAWFENPEEQKQMGEANRAFALSRTWEDVVKETLGR